MSAPFGRDGSAKAGYAFLLATVIGWGFNWPVVKVILRDWPPLFARGTAALVAGLILFAIAVRRRYPVSVPRSERLRLGFQAFTNVTAWMGGATIALRWLSVAEGALLFYTMPIWAMLLAWPLQGARPTLRGIAGLLLGLIGLLVLFSGHDLSGGSGKLPGIALALGSAVLFAFSTVALRAPSSLPPVSFVAWQVSLGAMPMLLGAALFERDGIGALSPSGLAGMIYMTLVPMCLSYLTWFAALRRLPASAVATPMLLVPVVGAGSAALFLGDRLGPRELGAMILVLAGVVLSLKRAAS